MTDKNKKTIMINTLILCFCICVIALFCFIPNNNLKDNDVVDIYTIDFNSDGGTHIAAIEIEEGKEINIPEEPTREGYIFIGWMYEGELYDFSKPVEGNITLTAGWKKIDENKKYYTVVFNTDGGTTLANQVIEEGELVERPSDPFKEGYEFLRWELNGIEYTFSDGVYENLILTAIYNQVQEEKPVDDTPTYRVSFNAGGGSLGGGCNAQTIKEGGKARNSCNVSRTGYNFTGWSPDINSEIRSNTTFTATWQEKARYSINFNGNGGTAQCGARSEYDGTVFYTNGACQASRPHYNFLGWSSSQNGGVEGSITVNRNITLYAKWQVKQYTHSVSPSGDGMGTFHQNITINGADSQIKNIHLEIIDNNGETLDYDAKNLSGNSGTCINGKIKTCRVTFVDDNESYDCSKEG